MNESPETDDECGDPMDYYDAYQEFLMGHSAELMICNGDDLIRHFENGTMFNEFMGGKK